MHFPKSLLTAQEEEDILKEMDSRSISAMKILESYGKGPVEKLDVLENVPQMSSDSSASPKRLADSKAIFYEKIREMTSVDLEHAFDNEEEGDLEALRAREIR